MANFFLKTQRKEKLKLSLPSVFTTNNISTQAAINTEQSSNKQLERDKSR
jgi:hypothetical protein